MCGGKRNIIEPVSLPSTSTCQKPHVPYLWSPPVHLTVSTSSSALVQSPISRCDAGFAYHPLHSIAKTTAGAETVIMLRKTYMDTHYQHEKTDKGLTFDTCSASTEKHTHIHNHLHSCTQAHTNSSFKLNIKLCNYKYLTMLTLRCVCHGQNAYHVLWKEKKTAFR